MKRLLVYSQDGMGLGHLRRTSNIAQEVIALEPECSVLVVSDSPVAPFFRPRSGMDYLKLPTVVKTGATRWRSGGLALDVEETVRLRSSLILQTFLEFRPDALLVDHMPVGALGELKPTLDRATRNSGPGVFLGLRDVLDAPEVMRCVWTNLDAYSYLQRYDAVFVYGCRDVYDAASAYGLRAHARRIAYCHYATTRSHPQPVVRPGAGEHFVVVMGGGGADAFPLAAAFLEALPPVLEQTQLRALVLTGPNMHGAERRALAARAAALPVQISDGFHDALDWLGAASAVVTMAGYNSICELLKARRRALVVPRGGPSAEQRIRSKLFAERGLVRALAPESLTAERLADELVALLEDELLPDPARIPALDGAQRAAALLVEGTT